MNGSFVGAEFQVNSFTTSYQAAPDTVFGPDGDFLVVWNSNGSHGTDDSGMSIQGQRFAVNGAFLDGQFQINSYTSSSQVLPALGLGPGGNFVVVWQSLGSGGTDTSSYSIQGQRFSTYIFIDGFESGDTSAWSNAVP